MRYYIDIQGPKLNYMERKEITADKALDLMYNEKETGEILVEAGIDREWERFPPVIADIVMVRDNGSDVTYSLLPQVSSCTIC